MLTDYVKEEEVHHLDNAVTEEFQTDFKNLWTKHSDL